MYRKIHKCAICGGEFHARSASHKYCDRAECVAIKKTIRSEHMREYNARTRSGAIKRNCLKCDKVFYTNNKFIRMCGQCKINLKQRSVITEGDYGQVHYRH